MKVKRLEPYEEQALDLIVKGIKLVLEEREKNKTILNFSSSIEETSVEVAANTKLSSSDGDI